MAPAPEPRFRRAATAGNPVLPDGSPLVDRPGRLMPEGEWWTFVFESDHPDYPEPDLRVLVLERDSVVAPRRVAQESDLEGVEEVMLVGFGTIDLAGTKGYGAKRQVTVPVETLDCTEADIADQRGCREGYEIVAGHRGLLRDSCKGDSGGPLYVEAEDGSYLLLGATSRGARGSDNECGDGGIYVRVDKFLDWIQEVTGAEL